MFILKIIVICSAILNIGYSSTQCKPNEDVQFLCQDPECRTHVEGGFSEGQLLVFPKKNVNIIGYNSNSFLTRDNNGKVNVYPNKSIKVGKNFAKNMYWKHNVSFHSKTFEMCEATNVNQSNKENDNDLNVAQNNTVTDEKTSNENNILETFKDIADPNTESSDNNDEQYNKTDDSLSLQKNIEDDDSDTIMKIESEDDDIFEKQSSVNSTMVDNPVTKSESTNSNKIPSTETVETEKFDHKNVTEPTSSQQLENDSSTECSSGSCVENVNSEEKVSKENIVSNKSNNNNLPDSMDSSSQHQDDFIPSLNLEKTDKIELTNNTLQTNNTIDDLQDNNHGTEGFNVESSHQQNSNSIPSHQNSPDLKKADSTANNIVTQNITINTTASSQDNKNNNNVTGELNETIQQQNINGDPTHNTVKIDNEQSKENLMEVSTLKNEAVPKVKSESNFENYNVSSNNPKDDNIQNINNTSTSNTIKNQPDINDTKDDLSVINYHKDSKNISEDNIPKAESSILNNDLVDTKLTNSSPVQELMNGTETIPPTESQKLAGNEEILDKKSINECTSESGCLNSVDSNSKYGHENVPHQYKIDNNVYKTEESNNKEKSKEFEPKSFVASFGHPDTCSGVSCITYNRNLEKTIKVPQSQNPIPKEVNSDKISLSTDTNFELENKDVINEVTKQPDMELSLFDHFLNWMSSPTLNSIDFLSNIFGGYSNGYDDVYHDKTVENQRILQSINHSELYFITVAVITLLFSLVYCKYQKGNYENHLLTLLATKDQSLLIVEKELSLLKDQSSGSSISTAERNSEIESLNELLTKSEDIISSQAIRIEKLEQEVEELSENGIEMHTLLSSALDSSTKNTEKVNSLKVKLVDSENLIETLTQKNFDKTTELEKKNEIIKSLQITVDELTNKNINLAEKNTNLSLQLEQNITKNMLKESKLLGEINNLKDELDRQTSSLVTAENEVLLSKDALQEVLSQKFNPGDVKKFLSSVKLSAELKSAKQMCESYKQKLNESSKSNQQYQDHIDVLKSDIANLEDELSKLEKKKEESVNKLNILTKFFKDQEKDYLRQINEKAVLCDNKEGESSNLNEKIKFQNEEIANYKSEIQTLKKEITDQEASFKIQISAADKKASDYWISFRQAERKLKEMELETAQLRNKLTMVDKKLENGSKSIDSSKDFEDELLDIPLPTVSPDFTLLSLLDFEPPPPILTNQRLPPLGALGQAPSPPIPLSRRHNRSLSPPSERSSVFRPLPQRYNYMDRQNSLGHSVESLDK